MRSIVIIALLLMQFSGHSVAAERYVPLPWAGFANTGISPCCAFAGVVAIGDTATGDHIECVANITINLNTSPPTVTQKLAHCNRYHPDPPHSDNPVGTFMFAPVTPPAVDAIQRSWAFVNQTTLEVTLCYFHFAVALPAVCVADKIGP